MCCYSFDCVESPPSDQCLQLLPDNNDTLTSHPSTEQQPNDERNDVIVEQIVTLAATREKQQRQDYDVTLGLELASLQEQTRDMRQLVDREIKEMRALTGLDQQTIDGGCGDECDDDVISTRYDCDVDDDDDVDSGSLLAETYKLRLEELSCEKDTANSSAGGGDVTMTSGDDSEQQRQQQQTRESPPPSLSE